jgi:hypothetical protein
MIYMKKLVAISVLFAILTVAVFAQDDEGKWKFGLSAAFTTDLLLAKSASGNSTEKNATDTYTQEYGAFNKGWISFFGNHELQGWTPLPAPSSRLSLRISNSGENYDIWGDIALDGWVNQFANGMTIGQFLLNGTPETDWYAKGTAGIFNGQVGTASYGGFVSTRATWNDWYGWNQLCRFSVWRAVGPEGGFLVGNDFRTWSTWGNIAAVGIALGDNFKLSLGYSIKSDQENAAGSNSTNDNAGDGKEINWWGDGTDTRSWINGSFMLNGRVTDAIAFDLFYAVKGQDTNTFSRVDGDPNGKWGNIIGAYIGIDAIENLGLSLGYTVNFNAYDAGGRANTSDPAKIDPITYTAPIYSGIDLHISYSGIENIGLTFNNNISLASVKGQKIEATTDKYILGFEEFGDGTPAHPKTVLGEGASQDWFHWDSELKANLGFIEGVGLTLHLGNRLAMTTDVNDPPSPGTKSTRTNTSNEFRASLNASYGIGAVTFGAGLFFSLNSTGYKLDEKDHTFEGTKNVTTFGIPILFQVSF